jgi:hypothetical protein
VSETAGTMVIAAPTPPAAAVGPLTVPDFGERNTRLWRPAGGIATGALAAAAEKVRQRVNADREYVREYAYALSIVSPRSPVPAPGTDPGGIRTFVFPVGPTELTIRRIFRQSVVATIGGSVCEEQGLAFKDIEIAGSFGLAAKFGYDSTSLNALDTRNAGAPTQLTGPVSGPKWTHRMLRHFFDQYAVAKAGPSSADVYMVFHNFKDAEHLRVVPQSVVLNRTAASRGQYPFRLTLRAVGEDTSLTYVPAVAGNLARAIRAIRSAAATVNRAIQVAASALKAASATLGIVRSVAATVDSVIDNVARVVSAGQELLDGASQTAKFGASFISSTSSLLEEVIGLLETAENIPADVTQTYRAMLDSMDQVLASRKWRDPKPQTTPTDQANENQRSAPAGYDPTSGSVTESGSEAAITAAGGRTTQRKFSGATSVSRTLVRGGDTLSSIAARELGDGAAWYELAIYNNLRPPYLSPVGGPGVLRPGDTILVPSAQANAPRASLGDDLRALYGEDIALTETYDSAPGRPVVDIETNSSRTDIATVSGTDNLSQGLQLRLWTEAGSYPFDYAYGLQPVVGFGGSTEAFDMLRVAIRATVLRDTRVQAVSGLIESLVDDRLTFDLNVTPRGSATPVSLTTAIT